MSYEQLEFASSFASEQCPEGLRNLRKTGKSLFQDVMGKNRCVVFNDS